MRKNNFIKYGVATIERNGVYYLQYIVGKMNRMKEVEITEQEYNKINGEKEYIDQLIASLEEKDLEKTIFDNYGIEILECRGQFYIVYKTGKVLSRLRKEKISKNEAYQAKENQENAQELVNICKERSMEQSLCFISGEMEIIKDSDKYYIIYILDGVGPKAFTQEISKQDALRAKSNEQFAKNLFEKITMQHRKGINS